MVHGLKNVTGLLDAEGRPICEFAKEADQLNYAQQCCAWMYPGCMVGSANVCMGDQSRKCSEHVAYDYDRCVLRSMGRRS